MRMPVAEGMLELVCWFSLSVHCAQMLSFDWLQWITQADAIQRSQLEYGKKFLQFLRDLGEGKRHRGSIKIFFLCFLSFFLFCCNQTEEILSSLSFFLLHFLSLLLSLQQSKDANQILNSSGSLIISSILSHLLIHLLKLDLLKFLSNLSILYFHSMEYINN